MLIDNNNPYNNDSSVELPGIQSLLYRPKDGATVSTVSTSRSIMLILGDFNAKTGSGWSEFPGNMGTFGKGLINSSGRILLEFLTKQDLFLTNTTFNHKIAHRTIWTAPERINPHNSKDGTPRRNPYRNQIDYVIMKNAHRSFVTDSRSYGGITTYTDHKLVKATITFTWWRKKYIQPIASKIDVHKLEDKSKREEYQLEVKQNFTEHMAIKEPQEQWDHITKSCIKAGEKILGMFGNRTKHDDEKLAELSQKQKQLKNEADSCQSKDKRREINKNRNNVMKEIRKRVRYNEDKKLDKQLIQIEAYKDDSNKCYQAIRILNSKKPKKPLIVHGKDMMYAGSEKEQASIITEHFKNIFTAVTVADEPTIIKPAEMRTPFTPEEIEKASKSMKNQKSVGEDELHAEYVKYGPPEIHNGIATLLNTIARTGKYPVEIKSGILTPLPKPGKKQGPPANLRPIILLSIIRKILAICLIRRCWDRLSTRVPLAQSAYQSGRSTTEQVFAIKVLAEKAITSSTYNIYLLLLDMSKAFDTICRSKLLTDLQEILEPDEMHMMAVLVSDVV